MEPEQLVRVAEVRKALLSGEAAAIRTRAHVSQVAVARTLGVTDPCVNRWERGKRQPSAGVALRLWELLHSLDALVNDDDPAATGSVVRFSAGGVGRHEKRSD
jgi:DNA-binding transcriptional regulator YiaG